MLPGVSLVHNEGTVSMLHLPISHADDGRMADPDTGARRDRAMAVLQYGTAGLALLVVAVLAVLR
jgi:hypothetical protein